MPQRARPDPPATADADFCRERLTELDEYFRLCQAADRYLLEHPILAAFLRVVRAADVAALS